MWAPSGSLASRRELANLDGDALAGGYFDLGQGLLGRGFIDVVFAAIVADLGWDVADDYCQGAALQGQCGGAGTELAIVADWALHGLRLLRWLKRQVADVAI